MEDQIVKRLEELREQFELGQQQMNVLDQKRTELRDTLLRISGAIQALEELLGQDRRTADSGLVAEENRR